MEQEERWNQFASSGRVTDYLRYKESVRESGKTTAEQMAKGSRGYEQDSNSDGNDTYRITSQGI